MPLNPEDNSVVRIENLLGDEDVYDFSKPGPAEQTIRHEDNFRVGMEPSQPEAESTEHSFLQRGPAERTYAGSREVQPRLSRVLNLRRRYGLRVRRETSLQ